MITQRKAMLAFDNLCAELSEAMPAGEETPITLSIDTYGGQLVLKSTLFKARKPALRFD